MVTEQPTKKVVKELRDAGFQRDHTVGSHSWWIAANGTRVSVPDGHKTISPGVYRKILKAIKEAKA